MSDVERYMGLRAELLDAYAEVEQTSRLIYRVADGLVAGTLAFSSVSVGLSIVALSPEIARIDSLQWPSANDIQTLIARVFNLEHCTSAAFYAIPAEKRGGLKEVPTRRRA